MTCEDSRERLQEQIDGTIDPAIERDVEGHLAGCAACRALAADLGAVADAASEMAPIDPPDHVWLQLAGNWRRAHGPTVSVPDVPRRTATRFHAMAAAAMLAVAAGGGWIAWNATNTEPAAGGEVTLLHKPDAGAGGNAETPGTVESAQKDIEAAEQLYTRAIAGLEQAAAEHKDVLEPQVAATLDKNLGVLNEAISESRAAVRTQPQSVVARESLFEALRKKVSLLQDTISLVGEISRGNPAGASRLSGT
ncbi:MAG: zf-HC2 domain-containing protein [Acidobacteriota bacterium]|nr:zf-HC2 domain-containing protein [Acidobacteriota bacterium]